MSEHIPLQVPSGPPVPVPAPSRADRTPPAGQPAEASKSETTKPEPGEKDPMRDLLERMNRMQQMIATADPKLAHVMQELSQRGTDPDQRGQPGFRTEMAYALQDMERFHLGRLDLPASLRTEMTQLAGTAVGLTNERMIALTEATARLQDRSLVKEIRDVAMAVGRRTDQATPQIESRIDTLENKVRLMTRAPEPTLNTSAGQPPGNPPPANGPSPPPNNSLSPPPGPMNTGNRSEQDRLRTSEQADPRLQNGGQASVMMKHSALDTLLKAMRPDGKQEQAPWEPPATPMADRMAAWERTRAAKEDDRAFAGLENRGRATLEAMQAFTNREGAAVMGRIQAAAKTEPGGMAQVLSEMREGGRFESLRKEFTGALAEDKGFAAAYDKAAGALAAYGKNRTDIEAIVSRRPDITGRLQQLDSEIGTAASSTPSKTEGQSMMEDITKRAAELLQKAVDGVKSMFNRSPAAGASSSPSAGP